MKASFAFAIIALAFHPGAQGEPSLTRGAAVRITSSSIESGWHSGHLHQDAQQCWMVKLDKPTRDHYTMLALLAVDRLQLAHGSAWNDVAVKPILRSSPALCREYGAD